MQPLFLVLFRCCFVVVLLCCCGFVVVLLLWFRRLCCVMLWLLSMWFCCCVCWFVVVSCCCCSVVVVVVVLLFCCFVVGTLLYCCFVCVVVVSSFALLGHDQSHATNQSQGQSHTSPFYDQANRPKLQDQATEMMSAPSVDKPHVPSVMTPMAQPLGGWHVTSMTGQPKRAISIHDQPNQQIG